MNYARVLNGNITESFIQLPLYYQDENETILNFNLLPNEDLARYGYFPLIDNIPTDFNPSISKLSEPILSFNGTQAIANYTVTNKTLIEVKQIKYSEVYQIVKEKLNVSFPDYSFVEVAMFPALELEIDKYKKNNSVGEYMAKIISRGRHTAKTLVDMLNPKITIYNGILQTRDNHLNAIDAITNIELLANYNTNTGWEQWQPVSR